MTKKNKEEGAKLDAKNATYPIRELTDLVLIMETEEYVYLTPA